MKKILRREINFKNQFVELRVATEDPKEDLDLMFSKMDKMLIGGKMPQPLGESPVKTQLKKKGRPKKGKVIEKDKLPTYIN